VIARDFLLAHAKRLVASGEASPEMAALLEEPHVQLARTTLLPAIEHAGRVLMSRMPEYCEEWSGR